MSGHCRVMHRHGSSSVPFARAADAVDWGVHQVALEASILRSKIVCGDV